MLIAEMFIKYITVTELGVISEKRVVWCVADINVHIDTYSAQTGVSRFLHEHDHWK